MNHTFKLPRRSNALANFARENDYKRRRKTRNTNQIINQSINRLFNPIAVTTELQGAVATYILKFDNYKIIKSFALASRGLIRL